jgi:hypothetical protein
MRRSDPACVQTPDWSGASVTHAAPSEALRSTFSLLRRPQIPEDRIDVERTMLTHLPAEGLYVDWIRMARAADGSEFYLVLAQDRKHMQPLSRACLRIRHSALVRSLDGADTRLRSLTLREERRLNRQEQPAAGFPSREAIFLFTRAKNGSIGGGGGGVDLAWFLRHGLFGSAQHLPEDRSTVTGLLPDGVATVEATFAQRASRGRHRPAEVYSSELNVKAPVQDNVASFEVARPAEDAFPSKMIWRAADGSVVRVIDDPHR